MVCRLSAGRTAGMGATVVKIINSLVPHQFHGDALKNVANRGISNHKASIRRQYLLHLYIVLAPLRKASCELIEGGTFLYCTAWLSPLN